MSKQNDLFRADVTKSDDDVKVNREKGIIKGFAVVTKGMTKDERGEFDDAELDKIVKLGNKTKVGVKSRFGHPNMSSTALGTFLGRVKNFRKDGDIVRADLNLDKSAYDTPDGDLATYVMDLAESDPQAFGSSMVIHWDAEERLDDDGQPVRDKDGRRVPPFIRVKSLFAVDVVDDPAANKGMFGNQFFTNSVMLSAEMTSFLDNFLEQPEAVEKVGLFLDRYRVNRDIKTEFEEESTMAETLTKDQIKTDNPELFESIRKEGFEQGIEAERTRVTGILEAGKEFNSVSFEGCDDVIDAVSNNSSIDQAIIKFQQKELDAYRQTGADDVGADANPEESKKTHLDRAKEYYRNNDCTMTEALKATAFKK